MGRSVCRFLANRYLCEFSRRLCVSELCGCLTSLEKPACDCDCVVSSIVAFVFYTSAARYLSSMSSSSDAYIHTYVHACMHAYIHTYISRGAAPLCVAGVALGDIHLDYMQGLFAWQAPHSWHLVTYTLISRGTRRGTISRP